MKKFFRIALMAVACLSTFSLTSCSNDEPDDSKCTLEIAHGLFIVNNGNYGSGNGSISFYNPSSGDVINNVFYDVNGVPLGNVVQSMTINGNTAWICVNMSNVVFAVDARTMQEKGRITSVASPRNIYIVNENKAYISRLNSNKIAIVNPKTYQLIGEITIDELSESKGNTEQFVAVGNYVYVNSWSYGTKVFKIDPRQDKVVASLEVGIQPQSLAYEENTNTLWVLNDGGGWDGNEIGYEAPSICAIDLNSFSITKRVTLNLGSSVESLQYYKGNLYWLDYGVYRMNTTTTNPEQIIPCQSGYPYGMTINPSNGDIYVANALDFQQSGVVERYNINGQLIDTFGVGIIPISFCWK